MMPCQSRLLFESGLVKRRECGKSAHIEKVSIMGSNGPNGKDGQDGVLSFEHLNLKKRMLIDERQSMWALKKAKQVKYCTKTEHHQCLHYKHKIGTKMLKKLSEKLGAKFPATTPGCSMLKITCLDDAFSEVF